MSLFTVAVIGISIIPSVGLFLCLAILLGWGNAGTRINLKTLMMNLVPVKLMGRIQGFFSRNRGVDMSVVDWSFHTFL